MSWRNRGVIIGSNPGSGGGGGGAVTSVAGRTGAVVLTAADVGAGTFPGAIAFGSTVTLPSGITIPSTAVATTQTPGDNSTKVATTAYADAIAALKANLASPTFTGTPSLPTGTTGITQAAGDNSTKVATTAYADRYAGFGLGDAFGTNCYSTMNPNILLNSTVLAASNNSQFARVTMGKTGTLHDITWWCGAASGNYKVGVYDTGNANATHTTSTQLAISGSTAAPTASTWATPYDPALSVTAGDTLYFHLSFDNTTMGYGGISNAAAAQNQLPTSFYTNSGAGTMLPKMGGLTTSFFVTPPSTITDANMTTNGKCIQFLWRIT